MNPEFKAGRMQGYLWLRARLRPDVALALGTLFLLRLVLGL